MIYSLDPYFDGRVGILGELARGLYAQKGTDPGDHELGQLVRAVTSEYQRIMRKELPRGYCGGRSVYFATCLIQPGHLPDNHIARSEFPLLVNFDETEAVMVLPARFWAPELVARWRSVITSVRHKKETRTVQVRCPFCHKDIDEGAYPAHRAEHIKARPDGQQTDYVTLPEEEREQGDLAGVPRVYIHRTCRAATGMPEEIIRSYLKNPYLYSADRTFCCGCGTHVPLRECVWRETNEDLQSYTDKLRAANPQMKSDRVPEDPAEVVKWQRKTAELGDAEAMCNLGYAYAHGNGVPKDHTEAVKWYRKAAELGSPAAMSNLGFAYENGNGVPVNLAEAVKWYRKAAELGEVQGMSNLGIAFAAGRGVPVNHVEAVKWLRRAADGGSAAATYSLGLAYAHGNGVSKDRAEAVRWYRKAAELGYPAAMSNLGFAYQLGNGVPADLAEAVKWYRRAAEGGNTLAMYNLGVLSEHGEGVPRDLTEATKWYRKAAEKGNKNAADALARLGR
jgi:TPR repeat protein